MMFEYEFNFTINADCTGILLSNRTNITTDAGGLGFVELNISTLVQLPRYLCEWRNGTLRKIHPISDSISDREFILNVHSNNGTFNGTLNVTANNPFFCTRCINTSALSISAVIDEHVRNVSVNKLLNLSDLNNTHVHSALNITHDVINESRLPNATASTRGGILALNCSGTDKVAGVLGNGSPVCAADATSGASVDLNGGWINNSGNTSTTLGVNITGQVLNVTSLIIDINLSKGTVKFPVTSCPAGQVPSSRNSTAQWTCVVLPNGTGWGSSNLTGGFGTGNVSPVSCPLGQHVNGTQDNGSLTCRVNLNSTGFGTSNLTLAQTGGWGYSNVTSGFGTGNVSPVNCPLGQHVNGTQDNGSLTCRVNLNSTGFGTSNLTLAQTGGWGYSNVTSGFGTSNLTSSDIPLNPNVNIQNVTNLTYTSVQCTSTDKLRNITINPSGISGICDTDATGGSGFGNENVTQESCALGQHVNGSLPNGSLTCRENLNSTGFGVSNLTGGFGTSNVTADLNGGWTNNSATTSTNYTVNITGILNASAINAQNINITGNINASTLYANISGTITYCGNITGGTDTNFCTDQGGGGDGTSNLTLAQTGGWGYSNVTSGFGTGNVSPVNCPLGQHVNGTQDNGSMTCRANLNSTGFGTSNITGAQVGTSNLTLAETGGWGYSNVTSGFGTSNYSSVLYTRGLNLTNVSISGIIVVNYSEVQHKLNACNGSYVFQNATEDGISACVFVPPQNNLTLAQTGGWGYSNVTTGFGTSNLTGAQVGNKNVTQEVCPLGQHVNGTTANGSLTCRVHLNSTGFGVSNLTGGFGTGNVSPVNCPLGQHVNGTQDNGSMTCRANLNSTGFGTSNVTADLNGGWINNSGNTSTILDVNISGRMLNITAAIIDVNLSKGNVKFPTTACSGTDKVTEINSTGGVVCAADQSGGTVDLNGGWINNSGNTSTTLGVNITGQVLNVTSLIIDINLSKGTIKFPTTACSGTDKVREINSTGGAVCATDAGGGGDGVGNVSPVNCGLGQHVNGTQDNGSLTCRANLNSTGFGTSNLTLAETGGWGYSNVTSGFGTGNVSPVGCGLGQHVNGTQANGSLTCRAHLNSTGFGVSNLTGGFGTGNVSPVNCPLGQHVNGTQDNESMTCRVNLNSTGFGVSNLTGGFGTSNVTADLNGGWINNSGNTSTILGVNITGPVLNVTSGVIDINLSKGNVKFPTTRCSGTDKVTEINSTGGVICATDQTTGGGVDLDGGWKNNSGNTSTTLSVNITGPVLNVTSTIIDINLSRGTVDFPTTSCTGTDKVTGINVTGGVSCAADQTGAGGGGSVTPDQYAIAPFTPTNNYRHFGWLKTDGVTQTGFNSVGVVNSSRTGANTFAAVPNSDDHYISHRTGSTASATTGLCCAYTWSYWRYRPLIRTKLKLGNDTTNVTIWVGLTNETLNVSGLAGVGVGNENGTGGAPFANTGIGTQYAAFRYINRNGYNDSNWQLCWGNGTRGACFNTSYAVRPRTNWFLGINITNDTEIRYFINSTQYNITRNVSVRYNVSLGLIHLLRAINATVKEYNIPWVYFEQN